MCLGKKHVPSGSGFKRCPECFLKTSIQRLLKTKGYPPEWASITLARYTKEVGTDHPVALAVKQVIEERGRAIHFYGPPSSARQATFAAVFRGLAANYKKVDVIDTGVLSQKYFGSTKTEVSLTSAPVLIVLGKEIETKIGAFYFRQAVEHAASRKLPMALFTDLTPSYMTHRYHDFEELIRLGKFQSVDLGSLSEVT